MENIPTWLEIAVEILTLSIMVVSMMGLIIPIFPGIVIIWLAGLIYGFIFGFGTTGLVILALLTVLAILGLLVDNLIMGAKAREGGASWGSIGLALLAGILGTILLPPIGGLIAAPVVLYIVEYQRIQDREKALQVVRALIIGWGWAFVVRILIGGIMVGLWGIWALSN